MQGYGAQPQQQQYGQPPSMQGYGAPPGPPPQQQYGQAQPTPGYAQAPPQAYAQGPTPRLLHVYEKGISAITHRHREIMDSDKQTQLYAVDSNAGAVFSSKPHMTFTRPYNGEVVGTATFHQLRRHVDLTVAGREIKLEPSSLFTKGHEFTSLATGAHFKWKRDGIVGGMMGNMVCLDDNKQQVAQYYESQLAWAKEGKFELTPGVNGPLVDEIVISGIAMLEWKIREEASHQAPG